MKPLFLTTLTQALNAYLSLDAESTPRLKGLHGKIVTIELRPFDMVFQLHFSEQGITTHLDNPEVPHTLIRGTPLQLASMLLNKDTRGTFFAEDIQMEGDAEIGQQVIELFDELEIDWEGYTAAVVGDVPAYHATRAISGVHKWLRKVGRTFSDQVDDYLHEEAQLFPSSEALQDFFNDIDALRMDTDRMEAKINRLKLKLMASEDDA